MDDLLSLLKTRAFAKRAITLVSGRTSNFYVDCKQVTLLAEGHVLIGNALYDAIKQYEARRGRTIAGVGGLTMGADPIASAVSMTSALRAQSTARTSADRGIPAFLVRKESKKHGTEQYLEGLTHVPAGSEVAIVEDVVTTGGSSALAIDRVRAAGFVVNLVLALVDRLEGGRENLEAKGIELVALFDRRAFLPDE